MDHFEVIRMLNLALAPGNSRKVWITFKPEIEPDCFNYLLGISSDTMKLFDKRYLQLVNLSAFNREIIVKANQTGSWPADWSEYMMPRRFLLPFIEHQFIDTSKFALELASIIEQISIAT